MLIAAPSELAAVRKEDTIPALPSGARPMMSRFITVIAAMPVRLNAVATRMRYHAGVPDWTKTRSSMTSPVSSSKSRPDLETPHM